LERVIPFLITIGNKIDGCFRKNEKLSSSFLFLLINKERLNEEGYVCI